MFKLTASCSIFFAIILTVFSKVSAQQQNRPATPGTITPAVNPVPASYASSIKVNYVRTWEPVMPIQDPAVVTSRSYQDVKQITQYVDGLGRPLQTVVKEITPGLQPKDMVTPVIYDEFGREVYKYLPYVSGESNGLFKLNPFEAQKTFMQGQYSDEQVYYSKTNYEASPLNQVVKTMAPGNSWAGSNRGVAIDNLVNTATDGVRIWHIASNPLTYANKDVSTNIPYIPSAVTYSAGEVYKNVTTDETGNKVEEYKDKNGQVVLKKVQSGDMTTVVEAGYVGFLSTYYVYDDLNQLRFIIPPKAVAQLLVNNWQMTPEIINELCFRYEYDARKRMIAKKAPGADWVYMIYDVRDRLVFTQDGNLRNNNQWMATLYDGLNRPVMTGIITGYTANPKALQDLVTSQKTMGNAPPPGMLSDLVLPNATQPGPFNGTWQAYNSITLDNGFESAINQDFTAEIFNTLPTDIPEESIVDGISINKNPIPSIATFIALTKTYYDSYNSSWTNKSFTNSYNSSLDAGTNRYPVTPPATNNTQTAGLVTGSKVRVMTDPGNLATGNWLTTVNFYDDRNRVIQINSETHKGTEIITNLYDFTGKVICSYLDHTNATGTPASVHVKTSMEYDHAGRLKEVWKTINDDNTKKVLITKNEYDELGRLNNKKLGRKKDLNGNYTADPIETLDNSYNIHGWLTGINKDYSNGINADRWFGMELNYDKGFQVPQYNGNITGTKWRSKGDGERRAYGYSYDKANRILGGDFTQFDGSGYVDHTTINFDMVMGNGTDVVSAYDENGNIKAMKQWGLKLSNSPVIDDLQYVYYNNGNKLSSVTDHVPAQTGASLGDFTDKNTSGNDYGYDKNGNMVTDLNKKLTGSAAIDLSSGGAIVYNHLNLPWYIPVKADDGSDKGTITYLYDAAGLKLKKQVVDKSITGKIITLTTSYVGDLVYESKSTSPANIPNDDYADKLQFVNHEEGRIRFIDVTGTTPAHFETDYFIKDHLGNVRMVLTEEQQQRVYPAATLEGDINNSSSAVSIEKNYYNINAGNIVDKSAAFLVTDYANNNGNPPYNNNPNSNTTALSQKLYKLDFSSPMGLGITLKVMAGDQVNIFGKSYYYQPDKPGGRMDLPLMVADLLNMFVSGGPLQGKGITSDGLMNGVPGLTTALSNYITNHPDGGISKPRAYINWVIFDEQFQYVSGGFDPVGDANLVKTHNNSTIPTIPVTKNGYIFIFCNNETQTQEVFFDNLQVIQNAGPILEETHYYPFGLTMAGISSKALSGASENKIKFQEQELASKEFSDGSGLEMYEFKWRMHDPQTGRFWQVDPLAHKYEYNSTYAFSENKVVAHRELEGLESVPYIMGLFKKAVANEVVNTGKAIDNTVKVFNKTETSTEIISDPNFKHSLGVSITNTWSTNLGGILGYIAYNNTNEGNSESWVKVKTTISGDVKSEFKGGPVAVTNKTSISTDGTVSSENGAKLDVVIRGVPMTVAGTHTISSNGQTTGKLEGTTNVKGSPVQAVGQVQYSTNGSQQGVSVGVGGTVKAGNTTVKSVWGFGISW